MFSCRSFYERNWFSGLVKICFPALACPGRGFFHLPDLLLKLDEFVKTEN